MSFIVIPAKAGIQRSRYVRRRRLNENETSSLHCGVRPFKRTKLGTAAVKVPVTLEHIAPNPAWPRAAFEH